MTVTKTKHAAVPSGMIPWNDQILHSESAEWVEPHIVVIENGAYWYEDGYGRPIDPEERKQPASAFRKNKQRHVELVTVTKPWAKDSTALAVPFNPSQLNGVVSAATVDECVDRANLALQAMRKAQREFGGKLVMSEEERARLVELGEQVHITQADLMIANRNRSWQQAGIFPGMKNKRIAHIHVESVAELPAALEAALKKRLT